MDTQDRSSCQPMPAVAPPAPASGTALMANPCLSRRAFFKAGAIVGALTLLGHRTLSRGTCIVAYADEEGSTSFAVYVLNNREVPFYSFDSVTFEAIPNMAVTMDVTHVGRTGTFEFQTDELGFYAWNMDSMADYVEMEMAHALVAWGIPTPVFKKIHDKSVAQTNTMQADITCSKPGYRRVRMRNVSLRCGAAANTAGKRTNTIDLKSHPLVDGDNSSSKCYLMSLSLDGIDVQYTKQNAYIHAENTMIHTLRAEVVLPSAGEKAAASVMVIAPDDTVRTYGPVEGTATGADPAVAAVEFKSAFLQEIVPGSIMVFCFMYEIEKMLYLHVPLTFVQDMSLSMTGTATANASPGCQKTEGKTDNRPEANLEEAGWSLPPGDSLKMALPVVPITFFFDHKGGVGFVAKFSTNTFIKRRNGVDTAEFGEHMWFGGKGLEEGYDEYLGELKDSIADYRSAKKDAAKNTESRMGVGKMSRTLDVTFEVSVIGLGSMDLESNRAPGIVSLITTADLGLMFELKVDASVTIPFVIAFIPLYVKFTFLMSIMCQILFGIRFRGLFDDVNWHHHTPTGGGPGVLVVILFDIGAEIGVGIDGVASIGVFGHGYIRAALHFDYKEGKDYPRKQVSLGCGFGVFFSVLFVKKRFTLTTFKPKIIVDSWDPKYAGTASLDGALSAALLAENAELTEADNVTQADLLSVAEYALPAEVADAMDAGASLANAVAAYAGADTASPADESLAAVGEGDAEGAVSTEPAATAATAATAASAAATEPAASAATDNSAVDDAAPAAETAATAEPSAIRATAASDRAAFPAFVPLVAIVRDEASQADADAEASLQSEKPSVVNPFGETPYNPLDGLKPTSQVKIASNIYDGTFLRTTDNHAPFNTDDGKSGGAMSCMAIGRIGTYDMRSGAATRLFLNIWSRDETLGREHVIEFDLDGSLTGLLPEDRMDVDYSFDTFMEIPGNKLATSTRPYVIIAVTSIPRSLQSAALDEQMAAQFITVFVYDVRECQESYPDGSVVFMQNCRVLKRADAALFHPRVLVHAHPQQYEGAGTTIVPYRCAYSVLYYKRDNRTEEGCIAVSTFDLDFESDGTALSSVPVLNPALTGLDLDIHAPVSATDLIKGSFEVSPGPTYYPAESEGGHWAQAVIGWSGADSSRSGEDRSSTGFVSSLFFTYGTGTTSMGGTAGPDTNVAQRHLGTLSLPGVDSLALRQPGKSSLPFIYTDQASALNRKEIVLVEVSAARRIPAPVRNAGFAAQSTFFSGDAGDKLFCVRVIDSDSTSIDEADKVARPALDEESRALVESGAQFYSNAYSDAAGYDNHGYQKSTEEAHVGRYQILESRYLEKAGMYSDFYPVAQLDFCPRNVAYCPTVPPTFGFGEFNRVFLATSTTDFDTRKADLYRVVIPLKLTLHVSSAKGITRFAAKGDSVDFEIRVRNVGSEMVTGFTVEVFGQKDAKDTPKRVSSTRYRTLRSKAVKAEGSYRVKTDEAGEPLVGDGGNYEMELEKSVYDKLGILMPGTARTYRFSFTMTDDFAGWTNFSVKAVNAASNFDDLRIQDDAVGAEAAAAVASETISENAGEGNVDTYDYPLTQDYDAFEEYASEIKTAYEEYQEAFALFSADDFVGDTSETPEVCEWFDEAPYVAMNDEHEYDLSVNDLTYEEIADFGDVHAADYHVRVEDAIDDANAAEAHSSAKTGDAKGRAAVAALAAAAAAGAAALTASNKMRAQTLEQAQALCEADTQTHTD